ncbi:MAG: VOC family protein [Planctomycetes bacterium]|nr:VOC family protein [Planctomycetota bacterium]
MPSRVQLGAVLLASPTPEKLADFYRRAFGLGAVRSHGPDHLGVSIGNTYLGFDRVKRPPRAPGRATLWFQVPDAGHAYKRLISIGAKGVTPPDRTCSPGEVLAWLTDPEGNAIGVLSGEPRQEVRK